ncbi:hypothetical protein E2C01_019360 [Portunus trituberculatus]|uniref:Uncharacterized protein n=1 Tax=Portunus trituberculatus TaxID=210409 RepID=A0A5B7DZ49_PORTR|nr:hypothetical protein [Portunus trituberculatus]
MGGVLQVLEEVGDSGQYQRLLYWLYVVPINFLIPWVPLAVIFMTSTPDHWCHVPGRPNQHPHTYSTPYTEYTVPYRLWHSLTLTSVFADLALGNVCQTLANPNT